MTGPGRPLYKLTPAQTRLIRRSKKTKELADKFGVNVSTIRYHRHKDMFLAKARRYRARKKKKRAKW